MCGRLQEINATTFSPRRGNVSPLGCMVALEKYGGFWGPFADQGFSPPSKPPHLNGAVDSQALIDQPFMRSVVNDLAVPDKAHFSPPKYRPDQWAVVPGAAGATLYAEGSRCALPPGENCDEIAAERKKT